MYLNLPGAVVMRLAGLGIQYFTAQNSISGDSRPLSDRGNKSVVGNKPPLRQGTARGSGSGRRYRRLQDGGQRDVRTLLKTSESGLGEEF